MSAPAAGDADTRAAVERFNAAFGRHDVDAVMAAIVCFRYRWHDDGGEGHVRGVDVLTVRHGKVAEKRTYVKG